VNLNDMLIEIHRAHGKVVLETLDVLNQDEAWCISDIEQDRFSFEFRGATPLSAVTKAYESLVRNK
jgi:hypothetical protein